LKRGLKTKFVIYFFLFVLGISTIFLFFDWFRINKLIRSNLELLGEEMVKVLSYSSRSAVVLEDPVFLEPVFEGLFNSQDIVLVAVYNDQGNLILSQKKLTIEERMSEKILEEFGVSDSIVSMERETEEGIRVYDFYYPIRSNKILVEGTFPEEEKIYGYARLALNLDRAIKDGRQIILQSVLIIIFLLIIGFVISVFLAEKLIYPIKVFIRGVRKIGQGNLSYRFYIKTGDEIEKLAKSFNWMIKQLEKSTKKLKESKDVLEIKVKARTQELKEFADDLNKQVKGKTRELKDRVDELERFHKLVVGRETKMIELKKEIEKLKEKLKQKK
jgi:methyl-accepting chemotaxis protein